MFIDADAHVDECADTWSYFPEHARDLRPVEMSFDEEPGFLGRTRRGIFIDGEVYSRRVRDDAVTGTTVGTRELYDVTARVAHMDELGVETQIVYPSLLLDEVTRRPEVEILLCEAYNRWIADRCEESGGRLRWPALVPLRSMPDALRILRWAKERDCVGVIKRAFECDQRRASDPYFFPLYELAQELDVPVCMHVAAPYSGHQDVLTKTQGGIVRGLYTQDAVLSLLLFGVYKRFPTLRFGFIEAGSGWLPHTLYSALYDSMAHHRAGGRPYETLMGRASFESILDEARLFVTCEATENLPSILAAVGDDHLCIGTDYGHSDRSAVMSAHREILDRPDVSDGSSHKITETNGRRLYGLAVGG